jgi:hypothetical protein
MDLTLLLYGRIKRKKERKKDRKKEGKKEIKKETKCTEVET